MSAHPVHSVSLLLATEAHLAALAADRARLAELLSSPVPDGWPEFPEAIDYTLSRLRGRAPSRWSMYLFLAGDTGELVGSGGFAGAPQSRQVEIGYEIAPEHRGRGFATSAASALVRLAFRSGEVEQVVARTLPTDNPSTGVLRAVGFSLTGTAEDPDEGPVWEWRLPIRDWSDRRPA